MSEIEKVEVRLGDFPSLAKLAYQIRTGQLRSTDAADMIDTHHAISVVLTEYADMAWRGDSSDIAERLRDAQVQGTRDSQTTNVLSEFFTQTLLNNSNSQISPSSVAVLAEPNYGISITFIHQRNQTVFILLPMSPPIQDFLNEFNDEEEMDYEDLVKGAPAASSEDDDEDDDEDESGDSKYPVCAVCGVRHAGGTDSEGNLVRPESEYPSDEIVVRPKVEWVEVD